MADAAWILVLLLGAATAVGCALALVALLLIRGLSRRVERLEEALRPAPVGAREAVPPASGAKTAPLVPDEPARPPAARPTPLPPVRRPEPAAPEPARPVEVAPVASAAPPPSVASPTPKPAVPPSAPFEWERWLGVRGAAVLGGIVVAIAGYLFLQYSIERGWITPEVRVVIATLFGLAALASARPLRRRGYEIVASSISGAGAVLLYAAAWAAHVLYGMISFPVAFAAMVAVTAVCGWLAHRHNSIVIAVIGLVGGFATPIALSSGQNRPIQLFGYVLLLDLAFLFVAQKRRWPALALVALGGTFVVQALWTFGRMDRAVDLPVALVSMAVLALAFALFLGRKHAAEGADFGPSRVGALVLPFLFAIYFAQDRDLGAHFWPLAAFAGVLAVAAAWLARSEPFAWLPIGTASGAVALAFTWTANHAFAFTREDTYELVVCGLGLAALALILAETAHRRSARAARLDGARGALLVVALGFQLVALYAASRPLDFGPRPWIGSSVLLALAVFREVGRGARPLSAFASCLLAGATAFVWMGKHGGGEHLPAAQHFGPSLVFAASALLFAAWLVRGRGRVWSWHAVLAFTVPVSLALLVLGTRFLQDVSIYLWISVALAAQGALAATGARSSVAFAAALATVLLVSISPCSAARTLVSRTDLRPVLAACATAAVLFAWWPMIRPQRWIERAWTWRVAALALVPWFFVVRELYTIWWPGAPVFLLPLGFEIVALVPAVRLYLARSDEDRSRRVGRIWFACAAILFGAAIVPLQVDREPWALTLALFSAGVALFHARIDARALAWVAAGAIVLTTLRLDLFQLRPSFPHSSVRVWNWVGYTHLLPGLAAIAAATLLRRSGATWPAAITGICALVLVFTWMNLEIANAFASGERFTLRYEHTQARDLTVSLAWVLYALVLLVLGVTRRRGGLRWASLVLLLVTIAKVFLFDLGHLAGLHRAASVAGLGLSLLLVSVLYQRFVFRRAAPSS